MTDQRVTERQRIADLVAEGSTHVDISASTETHRLLRDLADELEAMEAAYDHGVDNEAGWRRRAAAAEAERDALRARLDADGWNDPPPSAVQMKALLAERDALRDAIRNAPHEEDCILNGAIDQAKVRGCECWKADLPHGHGCAVFHDTLTSACDCWRAE